MSSLKHYGVGHIQGGNSGRYPWGSGENPFQHCPFDWLATYRRLKADGLTEAQMKDKQWPDMTTTEIKSRRAILEAEERRIKLDVIERLKSQGKNPTEIGRILNINESSVRSYINSAEKIKHDRAVATAEIIEKRLKQDDFIDISAGVEAEVGVTRTKFDTAVEMLKDKGYKVVNVKMPQPNNPKQKTTIKVLCPPEPADQVEATKNAYRHMLDIKPLNVHSNDGGTTFQMVQYPKSINSKRVYIRYKEEGGADKDGVIELRRNVEDISLGNKSYAQVRIAVDDKYYLKGMAIYSNDIPAGYDILVNSNKSRDKGFEGAVKPLKTVSETDKTIDKDRPFGAVIDAAGQRYYPDKKGDYVLTETGYEKATDKSTGQRYSLSVINILKEEGAWDDYSKTLAAQFLSKQNKDLVKQQINLSLAQKKDQFENIMSITNPTIRKKLLIDYADAMDKDAVDLKTVSMPGQCSRVLLPLTNIKDHEVYAPGFEQGTVLYLVRYPHAGTFEIPKVVVNNSKKYRDALGDRPLTDAIGVSAKTAAQLSGADFDGDHVMVLPEPKHGAKINAKEPFKTLQEFEPKDLYKLPPDPNRPKMSDREKKLQMGMVSNLITDMSVAGATEEEIIRAAKHSMVVIDAQKHDLDYKRSEKEFNIPALRKKYQNGANGGASSIVSRSSSTVRNEPEYGPLVLSRVNPNKPPARSSYINPETGEIVRVKTNRTYIDKNGKEKIAPQEIKRMYITDDAYKLVSKYRDQRELYYAEYANQLKALANKARLEYLNTKENKADPSASKIYENEVKSLESKLHLSERNRPKEREASVIANNIIAAKLRRAKAEGYTYSAEEIKKIRTSAMANARSQVGAGRSQLRSQLMFTEKEWQAIQSNAISPTKLNKLIRNMDTDSLYDFALPKENKGISSSKISRIKSMISFGYSQEEIAKALGISVSTVQKYKKE